MGEVIIAKHRNGSLDTVALKFIGKFTKFTDLDNVGGLQSPGDSFKSLGITGAEYSSGGSSIIMGSKANEAQEPPAPGFGYHVDEEEEGDPF
jgi:replicative DNA helicase